MTDEYGAMLNGGRHMKAEALGPNQSHYNHTSLMESLGTESGPRINTEKAELVREHGYQPPEPNNSR
jgi:hypothetical protein